MLAGFGKFLRGYDDLSATASAAFLCGLQTGTCSFPDQIALELCQRTEQVEDQATAGCRGVDVFGDGVDFKRRLQWRSEEHFSISVTSAN